jgi:hypothetical protein
MAVTTFVVLAGGRRRSGSFWYKTWPVAVSMRKADRAVSPFSSKEGQADRVKGTRTDKTDKKPKVSAFLLFKPVNLLECVKLLL